MILISSLIDLSPVKVSELPGAQSMLLIKEFALQVKSHAEKTLPGREKAILNLLFYSYISFNKRR